MNYNKLILKKKAFENKKIFKNAPFYGHLKITIITKAEIDPMHLKKNKTLASHTTQRSSSFSDRVLKPRMLNFVINKTGDDFFKL